MAESMWDGFLDSISGEEKLLKQATYEVEITGARPFVKDGETRRGVFLDLLVTKGPESGEQVSTYVAVPEPGNRKQGYWYAKKMAGFGDLTPVYQSMPDDLAGGLEVLCAAITGKKIMAEIGPGTGDYSNRNSLIESKPSTTLTTSKPAEAPVSIDPDDPGF